MAWTETTTVDMPRPERISQNLGIITGSTDLTEYHTTGVEITDITKYFKKVLSVVCDGMSDNLYITSWDETDSCFHAFSGAAAAAGAFQEEASGTDIGVIKWVAIGTL